MLQYCRHPNNNPITQAASAAAQWAWERHLSRDVLPNGVGGLYCHQRLHLSSVNGAVVSITSLASGVSNLDDIACAGVCGIDDISSQSDHADDCRFRMCDFSCLMCKWCIFFALQQRAYSFMTFCGLFPNLTTMQSRVFFITCTDAPTYYSYYICACTSVHVRYQ